jgi:glycosyltransferase involved in cell wall biosynthesis
MASGLAVISTLRGGIPEIVGDAGILVQPSTKEIQDAMLKLLANKELRADFGIRARKRAQERFSWDETSKMLVDVLRSTL